MTRTELAWLAGLLEGEGTFGHGGGTPCVRLQMTDKDVVDKAADLMGGNVYTSEPVPGNKQVYRVGVYGPRAIDLMGRLQTFMGARRQQSIRETVEWNKERPGQGSGPRKGFMGLTIKDVQEIRRLASLGVRQRELAKMWKMYPGSVSRIVNRKRWSDI
jgi:hypothetical protein